MNGRCFLVLAFASGCAADAEDPCEQGVPGTVCSVAGTGDMYFNQDGLPAPETALYMPSQVRRGPDGLLYIMDLNNMRLRRIEADGTVSTIAGDGLHAGATDGALAIDSSLESPSDFDWLPDGRLVFVSLHDPRIFVIDHDQTLRVLAGSSLGIFGNEGDGGPPEQARFLELAGIAVAPDGTIYVADQVADRVRVIKDNVVTTFAGRGGPGYSGDGGPATLAALDAPTALALDAAGDLYITDSNNCAIRKVTAEGTIFGVVGTGVHGFTGDGGAASAAQLAQPDGIAVASDGTLFIGDRFNSRVRMVANGTITTIAGNGVKGDAGDDGPARAAEFGYLSRVQLDRDGSLLISDQTNSRIRKILSPF